MNDLGISLEGDDDDAGCRRCKSHVDQTIALKQETNEETPTSDQWLTVQHQLEGVRNNYQHAGCKVERDLVHHQNDGCRLRKFPVRECNQNQHIQGATHHPDCHHAPPERGGQHSITARCLREWFISNDACVAAENGIIVVPIIS